MSIKLMSAVWECGPSEGTDTLVLLAIANEADDFGVGVAAHDSIAHKARCSRRHVIRRLEELEATGWVCILRKAINGKANAYVLNTRKIGVIPSPEARVSPLHAMLRRTHGDILSRIFASQSSGDIPAFSGDNPQPSHVTSGRAHVTSGPLSRDARGHTTHGTHDSTHGDPLPEKTLSPLPPVGVPSTDPMSLQGTARTLADRLGLEFRPADAEQPAPRPAVAFDPASGEDASALQASEAMREKFNRLRTALKLDLQSMPRHPNFRDFRPGVTWYEGCFRDWWLVGFRREGSTWTIVTEAVDPAATEAGVEKFAGRLRKMFRTYYPIPQLAEIRFEFRPLNQQSNPAA